MENIHEEKRRRMKYHFRFSHLIAALFAISFFLPSYGDAPGYSCAYLCLTITVKLESLRNEPWLWAYYTGFNLANLAFIWIGLQLIRERPTAKWARITLTLAALQVISWPAFNIKSLEFIDIGYYLWASAFLLLAIVAHMRPMRQDPAETAGPTSS